MSILKSILGRFGSTGAFPAMQLTLLVKQRSHTGFGGFVDLNNDLGLMVQDLANPGPGTLMPYFYARRIAAAGMYHQGAIDVKALEQVNILFLNYMVQVGSEISKEVQVQVQFQEDSLEVALELCQVYLTGATKLSVKLMLGAAQDEISFRDALIFALGENNENLKDTLHRVTCGDWVIKPEYCMGFFAAGWWQPGVDFDVTAITVLKYFESIGIQF